MHLSQTLMEQVSALANKYGNGQGEDFAQECFEVLKQRPPNEKSFALRIARQTILNALKREELRACAMSTADPRFVEVCFDNRVIDVDKYRDNIRNKRLQAIVDDYLEGQKLSDKDRRYLCDHRKEFDLNVEKYFKPLPPWMILVKYCEPYLRNTRALVGSRKTI